jgi:hypothetical protein
MNTIDTIVEKVKEIGMKEERNRIMRGLLAADLPAGIWPLIKDIINPNENTHTDTI